MPSIITLSFHSRDVSSTLFVSTSSSTSTRLSSTSTSTSTLISNTSTSTKYILWMTNTIYSSFKCKFNCKSCADRVYSKTANNTVSCSDANNALISQHSQAYTKSSKYMDVTCVSCHCISRRWEPKHVHPRASTSVAS